MEFTDNLDVKRESDNDSNNSDGEDAERTWGAVAATLSPAALQAIADLGISDGSPLTREAVQRRAEEENAVIVDINAAPAVVADKHGGGFIMNQKFKEQSYWDSRFESEEEYDWLCTYSNVRCHFQSCMKPTNKILVVGCGNSSFSADLYDDGFKNITNIDYSGTVVRSMAAKFSAAKPEMLWLEMDMLDLSFDAGSFDVVIDKAAMDAIMVCEGDLWHPAEECILSAHKICLGIARVLVPKGIYLQISFAQPHFRTKYLMGERFNKAAVNPYSTSLGKSEVYPWVLEYKTISVERGCLDSFLYIMNKY